MSTFDGFIREFKGLIRVDNFQQSDWHPEQCQTSLLYLLSHAHSDHMVGLDKFAGSLIYCSEVTKDIVMKIRPARARINDAKGFGNGKRDRTYKNLLVDGQKSLLKPLKPFDPKEIELPTSDPADKCRITLIPANHCPGSVMFLIQMWNINVLYTGDIRAEPWWVESLTKESQLAPFVDPNYRRSYRIDERPQAMDKKSLPIEPSSSSASNQEKYSGPLDRLDNIYLDTSSLLTKINVFTKQEAIGMTIDAMLAYPNDTNFFINSWTWGYEELLQQIIVIFDSVIHVDRYKYEIFQQPRFKTEYPVLSSHVTLDSKATRFHACERNLKCAEVREEDGKFRQSQSLDSSIKASSVRCRKIRVVCVNPWEMTTQKWYPYEKCLNKKLKDAARYDLKNPKSKDDPWPPFLICPLTRHSSFYEILNFVSAFQPKCIFPNTTHAYTGFVEFDAIPKLFGSVLDSDAKRLIKREAAQFKKDYELRNKTKLNRQPISVDLLDWKGIHVQALEKAFETFEMLEFDSEKYQSMWSQFFQTVNSNDKYEAAKFIEGRSPKIVNRDLSPERYYISSSEEECTSPSETVAGASETESDEESVKSESFIDDDSEEVPSSSRQITPPATTANYCILISSSSTSKGESRSAKDAPKRRKSFHPTTLPESKMSLSDLIAWVERQPLSKVAAGLQELEIQFLSTASIWSGQRCSHNPQLKKVDREYDPDGSPKPKKRNRSTVPVLLGDSAQTKKSAIFIDMDDPLMVWTDARDSIVDLVVLRWKICLFRDKAVEKILFSNLKP
ncbi:hypothetical protein PCASD_08019 [Puccinia coronata f. sp. avenae]|uniref:DNA repair metallo-beta-lactamase domain-containing protein n=1 Tax=Puccinia coronata f. sp. avenae TaxID=200324 RepID=A0A2N5UNV1_9BASI|nr:hypothetical protein PCASD_08019 [Puccinia coronata f. sp. avenae]